MSRMPEPTQEDTSFKRKLSKREKKQLKKQEKINKQKEKDGGKQEGVAEKLYTGKIRGNFRVFLFLFPLELGG